MLEQNNRFIINDVNGCSSGTASSGRAAHEPQVRPDRHQATGGKTNKFKIATWNVRTLFQAGKLENVKMEMERMKINILGMSEVRWTGAGKINSDKYTIIYSGSEKHERGVGIIFDEQTARTNSCGIFEHLGPSPTSPTERMTSKHKYYTSVRSNI